ncbi:hypothetical protein, partial [Klebsiella pneumoniae]|uniref:hypothetical protein n=1 Tax=Klebsiella pneumoniae TaxID=573 RepID=UPI0019537234
VLNRPSPQGGGAICRRFSLAAQRKPNIGLSPALDAPDFSVDRLSASGVLVRLSDRTRNPMLYAILCYNDEDVVGSWTKEED